MSFLLAALLLLSQQIYSETFHDTRTPVSCSFGGGDQTAMTIDWPSITQSTAKYQFSVLIAADEHYRRNHSDWQERTQRIVDLANIPFESTFGIKFVVKELSAWTSRGGRSGELLADLDDEYEDREVDFVIGFSDDNDFSHAGIAYVYSGKSEGPAMSLVRDHSSLSKSARTLQHELSHNFGLRHDDGDIRCVMNTDYDDTIWDDAHRSELQENISWYYEVELIADDETEPVLSSGDAAEDIAIWLHPHDPSRSTLFGSDKKSGLVVYDLAGNMINRFSVGRINSIDIRYNFVFGKERIDLLAGSHRSRDSIVLFAITDNGTNLVFLGEIETDIDVYGLTLYRSPYSLDQFVFVTSDDEDVEQWVLLQDGNEIFGQLVREFETGDKAEGIVADDDLAQLYIAEEDNNIYRCSAEPYAGNDCVEIDDVDHHEYLEADIEGITIAYGDHGDGIIIMPSQGNSRFVLYDRMTNEYIGDFSVAGGSTIDPVSETDGIDVVNISLGPQYPYGLFLMQDDENTTAGGESINQNFKMLSLEKIIDAFELHQLDVQVNPRNRSQ